MSDNWIRAAAEAICCIDGGVYGCEGEVEGILRRLKTADPDRIAFLERENASLKKELAECRTADMPIPKVWGGMTKIGQIRYVAGLQLELAKTIEECEALKAENERLLGLLQFAVNRIEGETGGSE